MTSSDRTIALFKPKTVLGSPLARIQLVAILVKPGNQLGPASSLTKKLRSKDTPAAGDKWMMTVLNKPSKLKSYRQAGSHLLAKSSWQAGSHLLPVSSRRAPPAKAAPAGGYLLAGSSRSAGGYLLAESSRSAGGYLLAEISWSAGGYLLAESSRSAGGYLLAEISWSAGGYLLAKSSRQATCLPRAPGQQVELLAKSSQKSGSHLLPVSSCCLPRLFAAQDLLGSW
ncbi:hypothetical protein PCASD_17507 [Puccinia coronata f. sp. avenae]|uniref:Uncharacterized protein n=1 Tax=Puccinia coronata f. sp. avenae TaxID=200324 RepID=A0A2N5T3U1_9BASI|nr:hypothetical protein PCASD_17507 [Puccinia coronata f. sp. avenae]